MNSMPDAQLCHIGIFAYDVDKMVDFYSRIFGLTVTDQGYSQGRGVHAITEMPGASISPIRRATVSSFTARRPGTSASRSASRSI
jgi:catechol 2,3-dioxygenase-like lactoylglutathione lyase family enzyme